MRTISDSLKEWKSPDGITDPLVELYAIEIDDSTTLRLVRGNPNGKGSVEYDGETYLASSIQREEVEQSIEGELPSLNVGVSNIDGIAGGYIEQNELEGRRVTITSVPLASLDPADAVVEEYTIQDQMYDRKRAVVTLGFENLFRREIPTKKFIMHRCQQKWENRYDPTNGCNFPSDQFSEDSEQDFRTGSVTNSEHKRKHGWFTLNALRTDKWDVNGEIPDHAYFESTSEAIDWSGSKHDAPFMYKEVEGDFDCYTQSFVVESRSGGLMGILCYEASGSEDSWVMLGRQRNAGAELTIRVAAALNGVDEPGTLVEDPVPQFVRMKRVGNDFSLYYSSIDPVFPQVEADWTLIETRTMALSSDVKLGLAIAGGSTNEKLAAQFPYFRFTAGGLPTCDRTRDGADGCSVHCNLRRMLAFPGIPRR